MADNLEDETLENPINTQSENLSEKTISTDDADTIAPIQETENMEVHHHTHPAHGKKTWKNYFWEFLMLFLAVFCGFLAEYQLEHTIEHQREKEYMKTMVEDLKSDTVQLTHLISNRKDRIIELDTLFELISSDRYTIEGNKIYSLYEFPYWDILRFLPSDRTIPQLKNAGNLRLIRKENVSNALIHYDVWVRNRKEYESLQVELANQINPIIEKLIDPIIIHNSKKELINAQLLSDSVVKREYKNILPENLSIPKMETDIKKSILKYINQVILLYAELLKDNFSEKGLAIKTLDLVKKEYHID